jgi:hypothetical protein
VILVVHLVASPAVNKLKTAEKQQGIYKIAKEMVPRRGDGSACRHQRLALTLQNKATVSFRFLQQA